MILSRLPGTDRGLLPTERLHLPTAAVIAIMTFAMIVVAAAGLMLSSAAGGIARGIEGRYVVQLPDAKADELQRALQVTRETAGVRGAEPIPEGEMRAILSRWLGDAASSADLPVPALISVDLGPAADPRLLRERLEQDLPGASLVAQSTELRPLLRSLRALQWLAASLVVLIICATGAAVVLAARAAFDTHRPTIEIMHGIGSTDIQLTRLFQRKIAVDAAAGAAAGVLAAVAALLMVGGGGAMLAGGITGAPLLGWNEMLVLALLPILVVWLATAVARWTVLRALRATL